jgi:hypothetical protein
MKAEFKNLQNRRIKLTKELKLLNEKEEVLLAKMHVLEGMLKIRRKMEKREQFEKAQEKLKALEDSIEKKNWSKNFDLKTQILTQISSINEVAATSGPLKLRNGSKLNRVRLKRNIVFSWSYEKLP